MQLVFWIGWGLVGLAFTIGVFVWAVRTQQFTQSRKAALIPFDDITPEDAPLGEDGRAKSNLGLAVLFIVFGLLFTIVMLALALVNL